MRDDAANQLRNEMTFNQSDSVMTDQAHEAPYGNETVDLNVYLNVLIRWWREILLFTVLGALGAGMLVALAQRLQPPVYEAFATAIIARVASDVTLDERFQTSSDANTQIDNARRSSLVGLVRSSTIASAVIEEMGETLPTALRSPAALLEHIEAQALPSSDNRTPSDLIRINARADSAKTAAAIANAWMYRYVDEANALYGQVPLEVYDAVVAEQIRAEADFAAAQKRLEEYVGRSQIQALTGQIAEKQAVVDFLRQSLVSTNVAALTRDVNLRRALFERLTAAEIDPALALLEEQTRQQLQQIADLFADRTRVQRQLAQVEALQDQIEQGGDAAAASNAVALQLLKTQIFATERNATSPAPTLDSTPQTDATAVPVEPAPAASPYSLQWAIDGNAVPVTVEEQARDVAALIDSLGAYLDNLDAAIAETARSVMSGENVQFLDEIQIARFVTSAADGDSQDDSTLSDPLGAAILQSYEELFDLGSLTSSMNAGESQSADSELASHILTLEQEIQRLSALLEAENTQARQLTQQRDLAWNAYDTLSNKAVELTLERTAANREVRAGTPATVPLAPIPERSPLLAAVIGGVLGLFFGISLAFLMNYMGRTPFLA